MAPPSGREQRAFTPDRLEDKGCLGSCDLEVAAEFVHHEVTQVVGRGRCDPDRQVILPGEEEDLQDAGALREPVRLLAQLRAGMVVQSDQDQ